MDFEEMRQRLFLQICDKKDLDLKGEDIKPYRSSFDGAFMKAHNIALYYFAMGAKVDGKIKDKDKLKFYDEQKWLC